MAHKKEKRSVFLELLASFTDYKRLFYTYLKDLALIAFIILLVILYMITLKITMPPDPGLDKTTIMFASTETLNALTASLQTFYYTLIASSIIGIILILLAINFTKEWVWSGFKKQKINLKSQPKFLGVNLVIYAVTAGIITGVMFLTGILLQKLAETNTSIMIIQIIALLILIIITPLTLQLLNFSGYDFAKKKEFLSAVISPFKSFSKIKHLLLPYLFIFLVFLAVALFGNIIYLGSSNLTEMIISFIVILIFILFMSWQKVYSFLVFERVYK